MKRLILIATVLLSSHLVTIAQNIGIGTTTPHSSAMLDITSSSKGLLIPRMTTAQRIAVSTPVKGLMVFDNDKSEFFFYNGSAWTSVNESMRFPFDTTLSVATNAFRIANQNSAIVGYSTNGSGIEGGSVGGTGVNAYSTSGTGVNALSSTGFGIVATSMASTAIYAFSNNTLPTITAANSNAGGISLHATANSGTAINATATTGTGVHVTTTTGTGINATSTGGVPIKGVTSAGGSNKAGVWGEASSSGVAGVYGLSTHAGGNGVHGFNGAGVGVFGNSNTGIGVSAFSFAGTALRASSTNGIALDVAGTMKLAGGSSGAILTSDANGVASWENNRVAFRARGISGVHSTFAHDVHKKVEYTIEEYDLGNDFQVLDNGSSTSVTSTFLVPKSGVYHFSASVDLESNTLFSYMSGDIRLMVNRNGSVSVLAGHTRYPDAPHAGTFSIDTDLRVLAGDRIWVEFNQRNWSYTSSGLTTGGVHNYFSGHLLFPL